MSKLMPNKTLKLSVVLATRNEEENIGRCLASVKDIADEIIVVDEYSTDKTREIAEKYGAKVFTEPHHDIFHITKEKALDKAVGEWILQLDADEVVTPELASEISSVVNSQSLTINHQPLEINSLFTRHQKLIEDRDGKIGKPTGEIVGYFIPRRNMFLGRPLIHAGVYPDGVIRLVKKGFAHFPQKSVHEQISLNGDVSWLSKDLLHYDSPTLKKYLMRLNRYTDLHAGELKNRKAPKNPFYFIYYCLFRPFLVFINLFLRHLGILDGARGFLWSFLSATHFPIAYFKYITGKV
ncbi:MAG: glycosyl transferase family protein [Microgenomates group bacterium GW2011_GWC1_41_20]|uniref:Glycosyl transferase, family 2 n=6 Tax=Candidatus Woeseibacteriota TaxID=1752722 RepID=A0A0G0ZWD2_9BACT|nr:MAG: Glycosyl transferase, family 2 [Candidatus Woesebacteria bacterium GW2011_GWB1_40_12]KKR99664.1 MAG: glycosyl transferase family protein [Microgenomates group bacterium GW2011_GWC1_41_20]KKS03851.1 MAG: Glycosyl transferase, family 2 [Candidatus Woesebacteria bacterium GW2011_GWE1_41_24]KKS17393.1 MAG: Glycosyl transferase, family 2 [Candidatus Woesebacteria bacterium GW2011_GWA1_41_7]